MIQRSTRKTETVVVNRIGCSKGKVHGRLWKRNMTYFDGDYPIHDSTKILV